jgi:putative ABC transport system substrate-binding protein
VEPDIKPGFAIGSILAIALSIFSVLQALGAEPGAKAVRVGYLIATSSVAHRHLAQAFIQGMNELGYVEGKNLVIDFRSPEGSYERLPELAAELVQLKPDVIVTSTSPSTRAMKRATASIPIVMVAVSDPVSQGLVASLARPGGNITGVSGQYEDLIGKMLELLSATVPKISRIAILADSNPATPVHTTIFWSRAQQAAQSLGLKAWRVEVRDPSDLEHAFAAIAREQPDALVAFPSPMFFRERRRIAEFAEKSKLPSISGWAEFPESGGLMSYGYKLSESFRKAATYVDKIIKGANPGDLPIEQPTHFELVVNLKTAKTLGITIPQSVLMRADKVIE